MSEVLKSGIARRPLLASLATVLGLSVAGGLVFEIPRLLGRRYPRTQFDDLLDQVPDRESAAKLGRAVIGETKLDTGVRLPAGPAAAARELRSSPGKGSIARAVDADIAQGRLVELQGWVLPLSLVLVSAIAAEVQPVSPGGA